MSDDEYDAYNLSEFTEQDFAFMDAAAAIARTKNDFAKESASPAVQIQLEHNQCHTDRTPFDFLSWKKYFSVTDLVSPVWCEVQYEYGLYGKRNRPLERRPSSFTSKNGKVINVHADVAQTNDTRLKRGKSVHQALEDELRPVKIVVRAVSAEERFGLRLVQLIDGFRELTLNGITRELPVFAITHGQVVQGVIDEIIRSANIATSSPSISPPKKKQRFSLSPSQQQLPSQGNSIPLPVGNEEPPQEQSEGDVGSTCTTDDAHELRIIDYKTRRSLNVPLDEETLPSRLQLMLYHRMLTSILQPESFNFNLLWNRLNLDPTKRFSNQFLKDINWKAQVDTVDCPVNLSDLVQVWISTVHSERERSGLTAVSPQLQLVYRRSASAGKNRANGKRKTRGNEEIYKLLEVLQDEAELAAIAQMNEEVGPSSVSRTSDVWQELLVPSPEQSDWQLELAIQQSLLTSAYQNRVQTFEKTTPLPTNILPGNRHSQFQDQHLPGYTVDGPPVDRTISISVLPEAPETTSVISPIIGTKEFAMDDHQLDTHLTDVLQWWFGARPARGVDASQTNRCSTCEYCSSCEWRENKAKEAAAIVLERKARRKDATSE